MNVPDLDALARADRAELSRLRSRGIPQTVGMAAAARLLAQEVRRSLLERIEAQQAEGTLAQRFDGSEHSPESGALAAILREEVQVAVSLIRARGETWLNESLRCEGKALALEERLARMPSAGAQVEVSP